ncbi:MAG: 7-cyano-7-deazaguanine synthase QueC [Elusimicrobiota bacterium]
MPAVVLLSGGLDSATTLYYALNRGYRCHCLIFNYAQRHNREIRSAVRIAASTKCKYTVINLKFPWSKSVLTDKTSGIPHRELKDIYESSVVPPTYVPARNTVFLSYAAGLAESIGADTVFIGANAVDYSGYPDCRPEYIRSMQKALRLGTTNPRIVIAVPLITKSKVQIVKLALKLNVPLKHTWSCYTGGRHPCGKCDSCKLREKGFSAAGVVDPVK